MVVLKICGVPGPPTQIISSYGSFMFRFVDAFEVDKSIIVVTELLAGGELFERLNKTSIHISI